MSAGDPPYVSAQAFQLSAPFTCAGTIQRSTDGGKTWSQVGAPATLPAITTKVVNFFANTSAAYDGPGYSARACAKASNAALTYGYVGTRFDGTPHLARARVEAPTVSAKAHCGFPW